MRRGRAVATAEAGRYMRLGLRGEERKGEERGKLVGELESRKRL